jgi:hypothetical protein
MVGHLLDFDDINGCLNSIEFNYGKDDRVGFTPD